MADNREIYSKIIREASKMGAAEIAKLLRPEEDRISKRQAEKEFSWAWINAKLIEGQITPERTGNSRNSKMFFSRSQLVSLRSAERIEAAIIKHTIDGRKDVIKYPKEKIS